MMLRRRSSLLLLPILLLPAVHAAAQGDRAQYKLGLVIGNEEKSRLDGDILTLSTEAFVLSRRFSVVERSQLDAVFTEKDLQGFLGGGNNDLSTVLGLDLLGIVEYTTEMAPSPQGGQHQVFYITVRLVNVTTGEILTTVSTRREGAPAPATPRAAGDLLFANIRAAFPPMGYVVKIDGDKLTVDLGEALGLRQGDFLEVVREGEQIIHPVTGLPLPAEQVVIATLRVVATSQQLSSCKLKSGDKGIDLGDRVRFKDQESYSQRVLGLAFPNVEKRGVLGRALQIFHKGDG
jgi:Curli production assembly/transport component CsgG